MLGTKYRAEEHEATFRALSTDGGRSVSCAGFTAWYIDRLFGEGGGGGGGGGGPRGDAGPAPGATAPNPSRQKRGAAGGGGGSGLRRLKSSHAMPKAPAVPILDGRPKVAQLVDEVAAAGLNVVKKDGGRQYRAGSDLPGVLVCGPAMLEATVQEAALEASGHVLLHVERFCY